MGNSIAGLAGQDSLIAGAAADLCCTLRPEDYVEGRGYSRLGFHKFKRALDEMDGAEVRPEADDSWGHLTPEAQASDENQWNQMLLEGKL